MKMKRYPVTEKFLHQVLRALQGNVDEHELKSIKVNARRYWGACQRDGLTNKDYFLKKK